jgi:hypothetical protein
LKSDSLRRKAAKAAAALRTGGIRGLLAATRHSVRVTREERLRIIRRQWRDTLEFRLRPHLLRRQIMHVYGPERVDFGEDELLLLCVVRNGALYVDPFMEHYRTLGVAHYVFLDNGSTDDTVERLCKYARVTVLRTDASYAKYENTMKRYLAERFSRGRWHLVADIDELFDYPCSATLPLAGFLRYLNGRGFTAVVTQLLDMFSEAPLTAPSNGGDQPHLKDQYPFYDLSAIERTAYEWSAPARPEIKMHWGGIRRKVFGTNNGLTKAALVRMNREVKPFVEWHQVAGAVVADVSCVLLHYPFAATFRDKVIEAARSGRYGNTTTGEYIAYARRLAENPNLSLMTPSAIRYSGLEPLIADGFLAVSDEYRRFVSAAAGPCGPPV